MTKRFFGTDGIRGKVNTPPVTTDFFFKLAKAINVFINKKEKKKVFIGRDTRESGQILEDSLLKAFKSEGVDCYLLGIVSTPIVSFMTKYCYADIGLMISASHNQFEDNGIKIFKNNGEKLTDKEELQLENIILRSEESNFCSSQNNIYKAEDLSPYYKKILSLTKLNKLILNRKIVVDCANGSLYKIAPEILSRVGLEVIVKNNCPDGRNINKKCGALYPKALSQSVINHRADVGIAFDGDGDRLIMCDQNGVIIDGDKIMAITCKSLLNQKKLKGNAIVGTHMSNIGLDEFLGKSKIKLFRSDIGDRYVVEMMKKNNCNFGGEQSGHFIYSDYSSTGDALLSALQILASLEIEKKTIEEILQDYQTYPQILINLKTSRDPEDLLQNENVKDYIKHCNLKDKKNQPLILIRKSGTERLLRVMVQSRSIKLTNKTKNDLMKIIFKLDKTCQEI
tara:strand:- start:5128 stop:6486 length:1359 start_codon:yes stop_codon:yes gene_type:complete